MYPPQKTLPPAVLKPVASLRALLEATGAAVKFLFLSAVLDHESTAIILDQLRSLQVSAENEERSERWVVLVRSVVRSLVPLLNRTTKELFAIRDNPIAAYYLRQIREAVKLVEGEKMIRRKREDF